MAILFYCCIVISFYEYSAIHLPVTLLVTFGLFGLFHFGAIKNNAAKNILVLSFGVRIYAFLLGIDLVELAAESTGYA